MKKQSWLVVMLVLALVISTIVGCSKTEQQPSDKEEVSEEPKIEQISIAGAGTAGTFYIMAAGFAELVNRELGINSVAEVTAGSVENAKLLHDGQVELGVLQLDVLQHARAGTKELDTKMEDLVAVFPMYPNVVQVVTLADSPIESFSDLKGKRVSVGSPGSGILATNEIILQTLGLSLDDIKPEYLSFAETTNAFRDGTVDAVIVNTAAPAPFLVDLETTHDIKVISLSDEEIERFTSEFPYFVEATIQKDTYKSLDEDVKTFAVWITLAGSANLPEDVVYDVTKTVFENQTYLQDVHVVAKYIDMENVKYITDVPFHPGAARYYKEQGIEVPTP